LAAYPSSWLNGGRVTSTAAAFLIDASRSTPRPLQPLQQLARSVLIYHDRGVVYIVPCERRCLTLQTVPLSCRTMLSVHTSHQRALVTFISARYTLAAFLSTLSLSARLTVWNEQTPSPSAPTPSVLRPYQCKEVAAWWWLHGG
jgi:hypothetical protein